MVAVMCPSHPGHQRVVLPSAQPAPQGRLHPPAQNPHPHCCLELLPGVGRGFPLPTEESPSQVTCASPGPGRLCPAALAWTFLAILLAKAPSRPGPFRVPPAAHTWPLCPSAPGPPPQPVSCLQGLGTATQRGCPAASLLALSLPFGTCQALFEFLSAEQPPLRGSHLPAHSQTVQRPPHLPCCAFAKGKSGWFCSSRLGHCYQGLMGIGARV